MKKIENQGYIFSDTFNLIAKRLKNFDIQSFLEWQNNQLYIVSYSDFLEFILCEKKMIEYSQSLGKLSYEIIQKTFLTHDMVMSICREDMPWYYTAKICMPSIIKYIIKKDCNAAMFQRYCYFKSLHIGDNHLKKFLESFIE